MSDQRSLLLRSSFKNDDEAKPADSLAQKLADHLDIHLYAWLRRTSYGPVWNDGGDKAFRKHYVDIVVKEIAFWPDKKHIWNPQGAYALPGAGSSPTGLSNKPFLFQKGKKPKST
jgi:hypothetical protein